MTVQPIDAFLMALVFVFGYLLLLYVFSQLFPKKKPTDDGLNTPDSIRTFTGQYVNVFNPDPETILIEDIAHSLAHQCRFGGHTREFYSVAQHCVIMSWFAPEPIQLEVLLHDGAEGYLVDLPRPIKRKLSQYSEIENNLLATIAKKFSFAFPLHEQVKELDERMLRMEWDGLMIADYFQFVCWPPEEAKRRFLETFEKLKRS